MNKVSFIIILSMLTNLGCKNTTENKSTADSTAVIVDSVKATKSTGAGSTLDQLQGLWQSTDDAKNFLLFEGDHRKESYEGIDAVDDEIFVLSDKCMNESNKDAVTEKEKDRYISTIDSDMCWYIVSVDSEMLTLSYMGRGNTLVYKRAKN